MKSMINNSKFIVFSKSIETADWKRYRRFLKSPYFNTNQQLLVLADALRKFHPEYDHEDCIKEKIFAKIYKGAKKYSDQRFNTLMRQLVKLAHQFLLHEQLENEDGIQRQLRLKAFKAHQLDDWFFKEAERQKNALLLEEERGEQFHYSMFLLSEEVYNHPQGRVLKPNIPFLENVLFYFQQYILWSSLKWQFLYENRKSVLGDIYEMPLISLLNASEHSLGIEAVDVKFYHQFINYFQEMSDSKFDLLFVTFFENLTSLTSANISIFYSSFFNIIAAKLRNGEKQYLPILVKLYKKGFSTGIFIENGRVNPTIYLNSLICGCDCEDFDWANEMIDKYSKYLPKSQEKDTIAYSKMIFWYKKGMIGKDEQSFGKVLEIYQKLENIPEQFGIQSRAILARVHFEMLDEKYPNVSYLEYFCKAFTQYLNRKSDVSDERKLIFLEFVKNIQKLISIVQDISKKDKRIQLFENYLAQHPTLFAKDWFEKKIRALKATP